jgi:hypothetical protein
MYWWSRQSVFIKVTAKLSRRLLINPSFGALQQNQINGER